MARLILASKSASRRQLMSGAGLVYEAISADIDERAVEEPLLARGAHPDEVARGLAEAKALHVSLDHPQAFVIGSDQTLSLGERIFHKPRDMAEAADHIRAFSSRTHHLNCGVAVARDGKVVWSDVSIAHMTMRAISEPFLSHYLELSGDGILQSVGAYQFEGPGVQLFERIEGDYFTILGLPMLTLLAGLRSLGAING
ncbi:Maf-like protein [Rhizobium sp. TRM95796]|uniref:Maf-like protein n=1 Tax=Rhizobium sp. TRM95796 TaxID=2979862 RepID=UPI0021E906A5|nr:Maf-like protein [Rhizobium sp. TRM95796]MCV3767255.1 Maf-like protein [Rhizobium sp. TRM95796]